MPRLVAAVSLCLAFALALPAVAGARRTAPPLFVGVSYGGPLLTAPADLQARQYPRMAAAGVESLRVAFNWDTAQPTQDGPIDLSASDSVVGLAAARHIEVMPHIIVAPTWNRNGDATFAPPADPSLIAPYANALVARYGPNGSFWTDNPQLPKLPIRYWQFWNEPDLPYQWSVPSSVSWSETYVAALGDFYRAIKQSDPGAQVVLAGLTNASWKSLERLYGDGAKGLFDVAAIHPYTKTAKGVVELVRRFRAAMRAHGDGAKQVFVTELGLPASRGRVKSDNTLQTNDSGMAGFLKDSVAALVQARRKQATRVSRVYWYTWASEYTGASGIFGFSGLLKYAGGNADPSARPAYRAFVRAARQIEGCARTAAGLCRS